VSFRQESIFQILIYENLHFFTFGHRDALSGCGGSDFDIFMSDSKPKEEKAVVLRDSTFKLSKDDIDLLVQVGVIPANTPPAIVALFSKTCSALNLSPFKKQIHLVPRNIEVNGKWETRYTMQTGIDGYRKRAEASGRYAGSDDYHFDGNKTEFEVIQEGQQFPETATVTVYKIVAGIRCPFTATVRWKEYLPANEKQQFMWRRMPFNQLGKCGEALALRKAFPDEIADLRLDEEMEHAVEVEPLPPNVQNVKVVSSDAQLPEMKRANDPPKGSTKSEEKKADAASDHIEEPEDATRRKTLLQLMRHQFGPDAKKIEDIALKYFRAAKAEKGKSKGYVLLAEHDTFETCKVDILEGIVKSFKSWMPKAEKWWSENEGKLL
jgi:phage recombination protein Bet